MSFYDKCIEYFTKIYAWLLPFTCILCRQASNRHQDLCLPCLQELPILPQSCSQCAKTLPHNAIENICVICLRNPPPFDSTHALFIYQTPLTKLIMELKFHACLVNARILGELMAEAIQQHWYANKTLPNVIIPVPLHRKRLKERGYNQAVEIAKPIAKRLNLFIDRKSCVRSNYTEAQAQLALNDRTQNIKNAFKVIKPIDYAHVAVIDDVSTTGETLREFCQVLKTAGVKHIDVWCCAKTLLV